MLSFKHFWNRLKTNIGMGKHGWRSLLPHPLLLIAFIILVAIVLIQVGVITDLISAGLGTKVSQKDSSQSSAEDKSQPAGQEKPASILQKIGQAIGIVPGTVYVVNPSSSGTKENQVRPSPDSIQFSFTDLFSGKGWVDDAKTNVYQDFYTTSISATPVYTWQKTGISLPDDGSALLAAKGNNKRIVILAASGNLYSFDYGEKLYAHTGLLVPPAGADRGWLDFDPDSGRWVAVLAGGNSEKIAVFDEDGNQLKKKSEFTRSVNKPGREIADRSLACRSGSCIWLSGADAVSFKEGSSLALKKEESISNWFKDEKISSISLDKIPEGWLLAKVRPGKDSNYAADIYLWDGELSKLSEGAFSSNYPGRMKFGYDAGNKKMLGIYAAYMSQALEFSLPDKFTLVDPKNYSRSFNARVFGGVAAGSVQGVPDIFSQDNSWWIGSSADSPSPRFLKISPSGGAVSLTDQLTAGGSRFFLLPGFENHVLYGLVVGGASAEVYRFNDRGYEQKEKYVWQSNRINGGSIPIKFGRIMNMSGAGDIKYYLTNNGGASWQPAELGKYVKFTNQGSDVRWKAELVPSSDQYSAPWLNLVTVEYYQ